MPPQQQELELDAPPTSSMSRSKSMAVLSVPPPPSLSLSPPPRMRRTESLPGFHSIPPEIGGYVWTLYGRATVQELRPHQQIKVELVDWKLAHHSKVTCILNYDTVTVLATQTLHTMSVVERLEYANALKNVASTEQQAKRYGNACHLYHETLTIVKAVLQDPATQEERADCLLMTVKCCNHAATCALHVDRYDQALEWTKNSMMVLDALERKASPDHPPPSNNNNSVAWVGTVKLFGECRIKALLVMAEALLGMNEKHAAKQLLEQASGVIEHYTAPEYLRQPAFKPFVRRFVAHQKTIKALKKKCKVRTPVPAVAEEDEPVAETLWSRPRRVKFSDDDEKPVTSSKNPESDDGGMSNVSARNNRSAVVYGAVLMGSLVVVVGLWVRRSRRA